MSCALTATEYVPSFVAMSQRNSVFRSLGMWPSMYSSSDALSGLSMPVKSSCAGRRVSTPIPLRPATVVARAPHHFENEVVVRVRFVDVDVEVGVPAAAQGDESGWVWGGRGEGLTLRRGSV